MQNYYSFKSQNKWRFRLDCKLFCAYRVWVLGTGWSIYTINLYYKDRKLSKSFVTLKNFVYPSRLSHLTRQSGRSRIVDFIKTYFLKCFYHFLYTIFTQNFHTRPNPAHKFRPPLARKSSPSWFVAPTPSEIQLPGCRTPQSRNTILFFPSPPN